MFCVRLLFFCESWTLGVPVCVCSPCVCVCVCVCVCAHGEVMCSTENTGATGGRPHNKKVQ